jgi:hypothetical protein
MKKYVLFLLISNWIFPISTLASKLPAVPKYEIVEIAFEAANQYKNPFVELDAEAELYRPDGSVWSIPLFWDGGQTWKLRISPDIEGEWSYKISSTDNGLKGKSGKFNCTKSTSRGSLQPIKDYPYHFQYQNGEKMWFMGDTQWALFTDNSEEKHNRSSVEHYLKTRASQGFNAVHAMLLSEAGWGNLGGMPFIDIRQQILNPDYWKEVDARIAFANKQGLIVGLVLAWGDKNKKVPFPWRLFPDMKARKRYARYIAARYSAYHVYFLVAGEWHAEIRTRSASKEKIRSEFIEIGNALTKADPHERMKGIHPMGSDGSSREFNIAEWMSFGDYQQNYNELHRRILESRKFNKPVVNGEYGYYLRDQDGNEIPDKSNSTSLKSIRFASWDIVMAGGYFVTGFGTTYFGGYRDPGPFDVDASKNDDWEFQVGLIKNFFEGINWWKLEPHDELLTCNTSRGKDEREFGKVVPPSKTYWLLVEPHEQYVIYARGLTDSVSLKLTSRAKVYDVKLFNPRTGNIKKIAEKKKIKNEFNWLPPDQEDWIVVLEKCVE